MKIFVAVLLITLLSACGGSTETPQPPPATGGNNNTGGGGSNTGDGGTTPGDGSSTGGDNSTPEDGNDPEDGTEGGNNGDTNPGSTNVSAKATQSTECGIRIASPNAELVIYNADWQEISRHPADSNGLMTATVSDNAKLNFSVITRSLENGSEALFITSAAEHPIGFLGEFYTPTAVQTGCECKHTQVNLISELGNIDTNISLAGGINILEAEQVSGSQVKLKSVRICRQENQAWPVLTATANTGAAMVAGQLTQYNPEQTLQINLTQAPSQINLQVDPQAQRVTQLHYLQDAATLHAELTAPYSQINAFTQLQGLERLGASAFSDSQRIIGNKSIYFGRIGFQSKTLPVSQLNLSLPELESVSLLQQFYETLTGEAQSYNLENNSGLSLYNSNYTVTLKNSVQHTHFHLGPVKGVLAPNLLKKEIDYSDQDIMFLTEQLILSGNSQHPDYTSFMQNRASPTNQQTNELTTRQSMVIITTFNL